MPPDICHPGDLHRYVLLHEENDKSWRQWFAYAGVNDFPGVIPGPRLGYCDLALQAAIKGQGIALAYEPLAERDLRSGKRGESSSRNGSAYNSAHNLWLTRIAASMLPSTKSESSVEVVICNSMSG